jgi:hypothetical protein
MTDILTLIHKLRNAPQLVGTFGRGDLDPLDQYRPGMTGEERDWLIKLVEQAARCKTQDRDIDERMKGMTKEEAVRDAIAGCIKCDTTGLAPAVAAVFLSGFEEAARAAIAAADKWDAEEAKGRTAISGNSQSLGISSGAIGSFQPQPALNQDAMDAEAARRGIKSSLALSPGLDSAIQDELDHPPASIMGDGK